MARVKQEELVALQQYCLVDRQLKQLTEDSRAQVRAARRKRKEAMDALLRTMETRGMQCLLVESLATQKYARLTTSHTTRALTTTLVKEAVDNHVDQLLEVWQPAITEDEVAEWVYNVVKKDRIRLKPVVSFSNALPRGMHKDSVLDVQHDTHLHKLVSKMKTCVDKCTEVTQEVRSKRVALQQSKLQYEPVVDAFLHKRELTQQVLMSKSGDRLLLRRKERTKKAPMTVAQFKQVLLNAVKRVLEDGTDISTQPHVLIDAIVTGMENAQSIVRNETLQVVRLRRRNEH